MAQRRAQTAGGIKLAGEIKSFIKENIEEMKKSTSDASINEGIGIEDTAHAIAYAIEQIFKAEKIILTPADGIVAGVYPVAGSVPLTNGLPYVFK